MALIINLDNKLNKNNQPLFLRVHFIKTLIVLLAFSLVAVSALAQDDDGTTRRKGSRVIDDTTKQVYGPTTSRYFFEQDVFYNKEVTHPIDTSIRNYHRFNFVQRFNNLYQDLGNIATAIRPIYYQTPDIIGATSGFNTFDLYWDTEAVKYYDTKSSYTDMKVIIGGKGRNMTSVSFSRNINPRWNVGFNYRALLIDKVLRTGKGDRNVKSTYYDFYTAYRSKDSTYRLFINFRRHQYAANEYGGMRQTGRRDFSYFSKDNLPNLTYAQSNERRINIHLFHQYNLLRKGAQIYHVFDSYSQANKFIDKPETFKFDYNNANVLDPTGTGNAIDLTPSQIISNDAVKFKSLRNEVGLKGNLAKLFYNGYYAIRQFDMAYKYYSADDVRVPIKGTEHYLGGRMALQLDSIGEVNAWGELESFGNYRLEGSIKSKWFEASLKQLQYAPGFLQQAYQGSHDQWKNNFDPVKATKINGYLHYNSRVFNLSPGLTFTRLNDYVYFRYDAATGGDGSSVFPVQSRGTQVIASPEVNLSLTMLRHITLSGQVIYTKMLQNDDDAIVIPDLFVNGQLAYANIFFNGNMDMQAGADVHWQSAYKAMGYDPVIQQFYRQNNYTTPTFPVVDLFFNIKIKSGRIFLKYNNLVQAFTKSGYIPTPYYPGQRNAIDFGFDLLFYD